MQSFLVGTELETGFLRRTSCCPPDTTVSGGLAHDRVFYTLGEGIAMSDRKNWVAVACAMHARRGCAPSDGPGFMQVCHGKASPLRRLRGGDRVAYYSPTVSMGGKDKLQKFVSIGLVLPGDPYVFDMGGGFVPFRKDVQYVDAVEASILPLIPQFDFVESTARWGYKFRFGLFEISEHDMCLIAQAMQASMTALHLRETRFATC